VNPAGDEFALADEAIRKRVTDLIEELVRSAPKRWTRVASSTLGSRSTHTEKHRDVREQVNLRTV
jgi:hypothetical protein